VKSGAAKLNEVERKVEILLKDVEDEDNPVTVDFKPELQDEDSDDSEPF